MTLESMNEPKTLTVEQVEAWREQPAYRAMMNCSPRDFHALCDMALRSLSPPEGAEDLVRKLRKADAKFQVSTSQKPPYSLLGEAADFIEGKR